MNGAPINILMIDSHGEIERGGAIQCARLAATLAERGHRVTCVFDESRKGGSEGPYWRRLTDAGARIERRALRSLAAMRRFARDLAELHPDIVHTHKNRALYFLAGAMLGRRRDFGWVANRGTDYSLLRDPLAWAIHRFRVDRIVPVADAVRQRLIRDGIPPARVRTIYGSFDVERFDPAIGGTAMREAWRIPNGAPLVGMAASFKSRKKGQDDFLKAAPTVLRAQPNAYFVLAGDGSPEFAKQLAVELGIPERVRFPGFVSDMPAALAAMDVVVCASTRGEGLTGSLREALAMARPVVSTDVAGNRELVREGATGLLTPPGDPYARADAICELLADARRAAQLGAAGRALVLELCTDDARADQIEQLYRELIAERSRPS
jgi:glycosyltransferase involved in cell wall biosynthesis